ncbi:MAG TPA: serine/threonine-protein kinase, partial [Planctomycetota bacterium]|nr:serine/threonine-protein kinase [Planctomycetota bacterium]
MPASAGGTRDSLDPPLRTTSSERAWEEYLEGLLAGRPEDLEAFCARHPQAGPDVRRRLEAFRRMLAPAPRDEGAAGEAPEPALPFERLGDFRLLRRLGEGGMGVVYLARQESLGRLVALKIVRPERMGNPEAVARFEREAKSVARLRHSNIITVFATGEERGVLYLAMELVPGRSLEEVLHEGEGEEIPIPVRVRWIAGIARALDGVHRAGLIHRDVKPSNIRITPEGLALLVDFGLARPTNARELTLSGEFRGTPSYASPEPALPFERVGDFRLLRRLGEGGMGVVYLARQESLGRLVALKIVRPERMGNPEAAARFEREAKSVARLRHPNIITVFATGEERGVLYLAMELVPGRSLEEVLREEGGEEIPIPVRVRWTAGIARALDGVHRAGLIHRDVKP